MPSVGERLGRGLSGRRIRLPFWWHDWFGDENIVASELGLYANQRTYGREVENAIFHGDVTNVKCKQYFSKI